MRLKNKGHKMKEQFEDEAKKLVKSIERSNGVNNLRVTLKDDTLELTVFRDTANKDYKNFTIYIYDFDSIDVIYNSIKLMRNIVAKYNYNNFSYFKSQNKKIRGC